MALFKRFPWLFILLALVIVANNILKFAPAQVMQAPLSYIIPVVFFVIGILGYIIKSNSNN
ncbi:hypothetical protein [Chryseobacterium terrae]|uniref:PEP-CTERM protein-sorting domain-containing protein n=1 Tax=Chryseobacterium terrae TaxID=3163299 RepID=A0ABW8Y6V1_9FLAO